MQLVAPICAVIVSAAVHTSFPKIGARDRAQAVHYAYTHELAG